METKQINNRYIVCFVMLHNLFSKFQEYGLRWIDGLGSITAISSGCSHLFWILKYRHFLHLRFLKTNVLAVEIWSCKWYSFYNLLQVKEKTDSWKETINIWLKRSLAQSESCHILVTSQNVENTLATIQFYLFDSNRGRAGYQFSYKNRKAAIFY